MLSAEQALRFMQRALDLAGRAAAEGEVPVGALVVRDDAIVAEGWNLTEALHDPTAHAEVMALRRAAARFGNHRLPACILVSTLEPCLMCLGAALEARVIGVVSGAPDPARGAARLWTSGSLQSWPTAGLWWMPGVAEDLCRERLQSWFAGRRARPGAPAATSGG